MLTPYEIFWLFGFPAALLSWYYIFRNMRGFVPKVETPHNPHPRIIFQVAARSLTPILKKSVASITRSCAEAEFTNYDIKLVVDKAEGSIEGAEIILVPKEYTCRSKFKARALNYALRYLPNNAEAWILHLDEDALVTTQCVKSILTYICDGGKPVANGPSVFPYDGNILTFFAEAQRYWQFYWLKSQLLSSMVHWLNGSNLLIRSDIEQSVGWDFPNCFISEDSRFGYEATKKHGSVFGWHGGLTVESPAATVTGLVKQRTRWFWGSILNLRYVPKARLFRRVYSILTWINGFILTIFFFVIIVGIYSEPWFTEPFILHVLSITALFWLGRYEIGVYQNAKFSPLSKPQKALLYVGIVPLAPFVDLLCTIPSIWAFIARPKAFDLTAKKI